MRRNQSCKPIRRACIRGTWLLLHIRRRNSRNVTVTIVFVGDDLGSAVGKVNAVRTSDVSLATAALLMGVVVVSMVVLDLDGPFEAVRIRGLNTFVEISKRNISWLFHEN